MPLAFDGTQPITGPDLAHRRAGRARRGRRHARGARRRPGGRARHTTGERGARPDRRLDRRCRSRSRRTPSLDGSTSRRSTCGCTIHGPNVYSGFVALNGASYLDLPSYAASVSKSVSVSIDDPTFANAVPARLSGSTWSVAVPTPAVGKHTIYARSTQGYDTSAPAASTASPSPSEEERRMKKHIAARRSRARRARRRGGRGGEPRTRITRSTCRTRRTCGTRRSSRRRSAAPRPGRRSPVSPAPVNMAYFGGHVQVTPKIYLVLWGWGQAGAFDHTTPGMPTYDPDGAGARMTRVHQGDGRHRVGGIADAVLRDGRTATNVNIQNPTNQSSAASGTTTRTRSTTTCPGSSSPRRPSARSRTSASPISTTASS